MVLEVPPSPASAAATHPNHSSLELAAAARGLLFSSWNKNRSCKSIVSTL